MMNSTSGRGELAVDLGQYWDAIMEDVFEELTDEDLTEETRGLCILLNAVKVTNYDPDEMLVDLAYVWTASWPDEIQSSDNFPVDDDQTKIDTLTAAIVTNTGMAPAFAEQQAEMLVKMYPVD